MPRRALSSWVMGAKPFGWITRRHWPRASANSTDACASPQQLVHAAPSGFAASVTTDQPSGRKSHAVFMLGAGMPGVSGELNASGPPTSARRAKLPGVVPCASVDGLCAPCIGSACALETVAAEVIMCASLGEWPNESGPQAAHGSNSSTR